MYTKKERIRYVERMWEEGLTPAVAHRLWGSPTRACLARWQEQALAGELPVERPKHRGAVPHLKHARWSAETKAEALRLYDLGKPTREIAAVLGIPGGGVVSTWARDRSRSGSATIASEEAMAMKKKDKDGGGTVTEEEYRRAMLDNAVLREMLRDPKAGDRGNPSNRRKAELGERLRRERGFPLNEVLTSLQISKSSYEYERNALARTPKVPEGLAGRVAAAFAGSERRYGYRRIRAVLGDGRDGGEPVRVSERVVRRIMRDAGLRPVSAHAPMRYDSYAGETDDRPANVPRERAIARREAGEDFRLAHDFSAEAPGELIVSDVTEFQIPAGKAYLSPMLDRWDGAPISRSISRHPDSGLCDSSLAKALATLHGGGGGTVVHTDGGGCYRSDSWKGTCAGAGVVRSMSRKSQCPDNAAAEGFFGIVKQEFFYGRDWSRTPLEVFMRKLDEYLVWFTDERLKRFRIDGKDRYETIREHRERCGYALD